jgi:hypothetical protein
MATLQHSHSRPAMLLCRHVSDATPAERRAALIYAPFSPRADSRFFIEYISAFIATRPILLSAELSDIVSVITITEPQH